MHVVLRDLLSRERKRVVPRISRALDLPIRPVYIFLSYIGRALLRYQVRSLEPCYKSTP
jgi:hypothetical protein